ncbi:MAG: dihydrofolate reductase [Chitinophagaceae bacterium]
MNISLIVAAAKNNAIGKNNQLLWHLPNDMKFFKQTTWALPIVMGRKTFESFGSKSLNGRLNIVITNQKNYNAAGAVVVNSIDDAIFVAQQHDYKEVMIIGGGEIYKQALPKANIIYLTRVDTIIDGDTFFEMNEDDWQLSFADKKIADEKHLYNYTFETWTRK